MSRTLESKLEQAILDHLEHFLMEMGKGYALVDRQMHIHTEDNDYYIDLVFYNYLLKCFVLVDLKTTKVSYEDVGQMDMYLKLFDTYKLPEGDNPTIGIIRCRCGTFFYSCHQQADVCFKVSYVYAVKGSFGT